ncbi:unnamed protein product [Tilletia controversa]|uniref:Coronin n=1 Tax=Tilletia controversa TaxID=13291 RepID=A0A8X7MMJ4_9BASI|nr:hypothetical protein A4X06_0g7614 [Tilletia controversa]CAD6978783.1 unnamed protein product [Tilletia controversa]
MSRFVRPSKYRHVFGNGAKKEASYDNVKVTNSAWDTNMIAANGKFISVNWNVGGGGAFAILPVARTGKLPDIYPLCRGHTASILDTAFSPFDDNLVVSASDDGTVGVFNIDEDAFGVLDLSEKDRERLGGPQDFMPVRKLAGGGRKIGQVVFHPTAANVLAAASGDHVIKLWDIEAAQERVSLSGFGDTIQDLSFDYTGSTIVATCRDRKLRTFDTRQGGEAVQVVDGHGGIKGSRAAWCGSLDRIITTGFSKMSDRQMFLWDSKNLAAGPIKSIVLDSSSGVTMPFWSDNNIVFLAGKGDGNIRYYELESDELHFLTEYKSSEPQRGACFVPRRCLNAEENEIARAYKVTGNSVQPISFLVPRRAESFQADIFPPAPSAVPAMSAAEFFNGKTSGPKLISLEDGKGVGGGESNVRASVPAAAPVAAQAPALASSSEAAPAPTPAPAAAPTSAPAPAPAAAASQPLPTPTRKTTAPAPEPAAAPSPVSAPARAPSPVKTNNNSSYGSRATGLPSSGGGATSSYSSLGGLPSAGSRVSRPASPVKGNSYTNGSAQVDELAAEVAKLRVQLVERDGYIRKLELENEK